MCHDIRTGKNYLVGQSWQLDQCTTCYCGKSGKAACALQMCERDPKCKDLLIDNNECCPKCKDENGKHCSYFALFQSSAISLILLNIHEKRTKMTKKEMLNTDIELKQQDIMTSSMSKH